MTLPMATMCLIDGHAFAGALFIALAHDFRIMTTDPKVLMSLSEINIGIPFPVALSVFLSTLLSAQTVR